jgi:putative DNA primase/helicase
VKDRAFHSRLSEAHDRPAYAAEDAVAGLPEAEAPQIQVPQPGHLIDLPAPAAWTQSAENRLRSALAAIPTDPQALDETLGNPPGSHLVWINIGRALERLEWGERGYVIWRDWSVQSAEEFDEQGLLTNWRSFRNTRLSEKPVTARTIFHYARQFGWKDELVEPTYPATNSMPIEEARRALDQQIDEFIRLTDPANLNWAEQMALEGPPPAQAIRASTGIGKTQRFAARLARRKPALPVLYVVPTHRLGEDVAKHFERHGLTARVYRGRDAADPAIPGNLDRPEKERTKMCLEPESVALAKACGQRIDTACCRKTKDQLCRSFEACGYQRQLRGDAPDVWLAAHNMLFHPLRPFNEVACVVIDETFYPHGIVGMTAHGDEGEHVFTVDDLEGLFDPDAPHLTFRLDAKFIALLREHPLGGIERDRVVGMMTPDACTDALKMEWHIVNSVVLTPTMTAEQVAAAQKRVPTIRKARFRIGMWHALRELLEAPPGTVSGRLLLRENKKGKRVLRSRGVREIVEAREVPTLILDATLPDSAILQVWYPQLEVVADIEVQMSTAVHIRQVLKAPVSQVKMWGRGKKAVGRNRQAVRRYVLQRWLESGRRSMLVVCQKDVEKWLREAGLPEGIAVEHFNAISGLDEHKHVRSLILIGRTVPSPIAVEDVAGALTGVQPVKVPPAEEGKPSTWYERVTRGIRMADGTGVAVECDQHPDPMAEALRWQICEAELMQALGRARGINRDAGAPLQIDVLADVVLPVTVDETVTWEEPSALVEAAVEGIVLNSPSDMSRAWPGLWATAKAAERMLERLKAATGRGENPRFSSYTLLLEKRGFSSLLYRLAATKFSLAVFNPAALPNPRPWLEARLGAALASLLHLFRPGEVPPLAGELAGGVDDEKVLVVRPPVEQSGTSPKITPPTLFLTPRWIAARDRILARAAERRAAEERQQKTKGSDSALFDLKAEESRTHVYGALSKEARLYALGLLESS